MRISDLRLPDLFPDRDDDLLLVTIAVLAMIYIGTGEGAWSRQRWIEGGTGFGFAVSLVTGRKLGERRGFRRGYRSGFNTYNPALRDPRSGDDLPDGWHRDDRGRLHDEHGRYVSEDDVDDER